MNIAHILHRAADTDAERIGLVCEGRRWSYGALLAAAQGAADLFRARGVSHVVLLDESSEATAIALFGAAIAGVPYVPLNYRLADADLAALLARVAPAYVIGDTGRIARLSASADHVVRTRAEFVTEARATAASGKNHDGAGVAVQIFTSGTTGMPKAAILRHAHLLAYVFGTVQFAAAEESEASLVSAPPYHIASIAALLGSVWAMRRILLLPAFAPYAWLELAAAERASYAFVVPTMLGRILDRIEAGADGIGTLKAISYGGGRMPRALIERALTMLPGVRFTNSYGLTETCSTIAMLGPDDHRAAHGSKDPAVRARLGAVGKPLPTIQVEIRDEAGQPLPAGEHGELYVRGGQVSGEYSDRSALDADGWFPTRDAGWRDAEGYLFLAGRADDVIVRGGENISPGEIEDVLLTHPAVADACAVGVPSLEWGEAIAVAVVTRPANAAPIADELKALIRGRLRSSRVPERIIQLETLPYNDTGKLLRREVRSLFEH